MAKKKNNKYSFKGKTNKSMQRRKKDESSFGYMQDLPKGVKMYSPLPGGKETFDILPYRVTNEAHPNKKEMDEGIWWGAPFLTHDKVGSKGEKIVCPTSFGLKCPICEYFTKRQKEGADWDELKELKPKKRSLYAVIPFKNPKFEEKIHILDMSFFLFEELLIEETEADPDYENFAGIYDGMSLVVSWKKKTFNGHDYATARKIDFKERKKQYEEDILDKVPKLDSLLKVLEYEEINTKFFELEDLEDSVENPPKKEKKGKKEKKAAKSPKAEKKEKAPKAEKKEKAPKAEKKEKAPKAEKKGAKDDCPHGHKFGKDCEKFEDCDDCDNWDECSEFKG